jgi:hypothetical protein
MFIGLEIESITYAEDAIHLSLSDGISITSTTGIRYRGTEPTTRIRISFDGNGRDCRRGSY